MHLVVVGVNYKTAPLELRERLSVDEGELGEALGKLKSRSHITAACIVSTCNRTEIYAVTRSKSDEDQILTFLSEHGNVSIEQLKGCIYCYAGHHAVKHLFEVACGLDSMALGETQVLGQIKNAYCTAGESGATDSLINNLFQKAIEVGKRARTETGISCGAYSIGSAAVELARVVFGSLQGRTALLLGAGKMSSLAATHLQSNGVEKVYVASRTRERAEELSASLSGIPIDFHQFEDALTEVDFLISSTSAPHALITRELMERVMAKRACSPIFLIDIAVPRDVAPDVGGLEGVFVYNIDDLQVLVDRCRLQREAEVGKVREIIDFETESFMVYIRSLEAVPLIKQLRAKFDSVYESEWERCESKLEHLSDEEKECVRKAIKSAVAKLTHDPIIRMKEYASNGGSEKLDVVRELFGLPKTPESKNK